MMMCICVDIYKSSQLYVIIKQDNRQMSINLKSILHGIIMMISNTIYNKTVSSKELEEPRMFNFTQSIVSIK